MMRRALLLVLGLLLALAAEAILWNAAGLYDHDDPWLSADFTRIVGLDLVIQGVLAALWAAVCVGRAVAPWRVAPFAGEPTSTTPTDSAWTVSGGGPVVPVLGLLFLLAAICPFQQAQRYAERLEVMDDMPGQFGKDLVESVRTSERTERTFGVLWLVVGGVLLASPLFLKRRAWQLGWRVRAVGCAVVSGGALLSGLGAFVWFANGLAMEGASRELSLAGHVGMIAGTVVAVVGSVAAVIGKQ
jgi:hypothetical protein